MSMDDSVETTRLHMFRRYHCECCGNMVHVDDAVWINPNNGQATTGDEGRPYHVHCAPEQHTYLPEF
jgi:hypothetical protein